MNCRACWLGLMLAALAAAPVAAERRAIRTFTTADGLPRDQVRALLSDSRGFLWLGTEEGLARFDGVEFRRYGPQEGLAHPAVRSLLEDRAGEYWIGTTGGLYRFTPHSRRFVLLPQRSTTPPASGSTPLVYAILQDRHGVIWCGTGRGLYRVQQEGGWLEEVPLDLPGTERGGVVGSLLDARDGALWIGSGSGLYRRTQDGRLQHVTVADGLPDREVWALAQDAAGNVWAGTRMGLARLDVAPASARPIVRRVYGERDWTGPANVKALYTSPHGDLWVGLTRGVVRLSAPPAIPSPAQEQTRRRGQREGGRALTPAADAARDGLASVPVASDVGLSELFVYALTADSAGNLWVATNTGAMRLAHGGFVTYDEEDGLVAAGVRSLFEDRQGRVCATVRADGYRLQCLDGRRFSNVAVPVGDGWNLMWGWLHLTVQDRAGDWWVPTASGLYRFASGPIASLASRRPIAIYTSRDGLDVDHIFRLYEDSRGDLWMSTYSDAQNGLCRRDRASGRIRCYGAADGVPQPTPAAFAFAEDRRGQVWIGFQGGHLARCASSRCSFIGRDSAAPAAVPSHPNPLPQGEEGILPQGRGGVPPGILRDLHVDRDGRLWIASDSGGVGRLDDVEAAAPRVERYTSAEGLSSQTIWAIAEDESGRIYLAGGRGIDRLDPRTREIVRYTDADGLARGEVRAAMRASDGTLWFAATTGLSSLSPRDEPLRTLQPVRIVGLRVAGDPRPVSEVGERVIDDLRLRSDARSIEIAFVSPRFGLGQDLRYEYKLDGVDAGWQATTAAAQRSVTYAGLPAGTHRFAVRARSADGRLASPPALVTFTVDRPVWLRWWFLALCFTACAAVLAAWHRARLARIVEIERVRTRIASDLHDEIGAGLSEIAILSEVVHRRLSSPRRPAARSLTQIAATSRELVDSMSDIVWAINPRKDSLINLTQRMRGFATDLLTARGITLRFDTDDRDDDVAVDAETRRQVFLIFKESLNNVVRHADCCSVAIDFRLRGDGLRLSVADDGCGIPSLQIPSAQIPSPTMPGERVRVRGNDATSNGGGQGLASMRRRARELGGTLTIDTGARGGTTVTLVAPFGRRARWRPYEPT